MLFRVDPNADNIEPVYIYDDPTLHPIELSGHWIEQKGFGRIRSIRTTPADTDRFCSVPLLNRSSNLDYANDWAGGAMTTYQRNLNITNVQRLRTWWDRNDTVSPNTPLVWVPAGHLGMGFDNNQGQCQGQICPSAWVLQVCACGETATQYGAQFTDWYFDHCRACGWNGRPANLIDGQHRIRGMANRITDSGLPRYDEPIFVSVISSQGPGALNQMQAARMFIEINGGANPLGKLHNNYLASHFSILQYKDPIERMAFEVAVSLNTPAGQPFDDWYQDTGAMNLGRVQLMEGTPNCDFIPAWRIAKAVTGMHDRNFEMVNSAGAITPGKVYDAAAVPAGGFTARYIREFSQYLRAITEVWPGTAGARSMPAWRSDRFTTGNLQTGAVLRTLLQLFPYITLRLMRNGSAVNEVNYANELQTFANVPWTGLWNSNTGWLQGDSGIREMSNLLIRLLKYVPIGAASTPGGRWVAAGTIPDLTAWIAGPHDSFVVSNLVANVATVEFDCVTEIAIIPGSTLPTSLLGSEPSVVRVTQWRAGKALGTWETQHQLESTTGTNTIDIASMGISATKGDMLELAVSSLTSYNDTIVWDDDTNAGASISAIVA
jgi:hypothetical protein